MSIVSCEVQLTYGRESSMSLRSKKRNRSFGWHGIEVHVTLADVMSDLVGATR